MKYKLILSILDLDNAEIVYFNVSKINLTRLSVTSNKLCRSALGCLFFTHCRVFDTFSWHLLNKQTRRWERAEVLLLFRLKEEKIPKNPQCQKHLQIVFKVSVCTVYFCFQWGTNGEVLASGGLTQYLRSEWMWWMVCGGLTNIWQLFSLRKEPQTQIDSAFLNGSSLFVKTKKRLCLMGNDP